MYCEQNKYDYNAGMHVEMDYDVKSIPQVGLTLVSLLCGTELSVRSPEL